jgi:hypothetical protein
MCSSALQCQTACFLQHLHQLDAIPWSMLPLLLLYRARRMTIWWACCGMLACWTPTSPCWLLLVHLATSCSLYLHAGPH